MAKTTTKRRDSEDEVLVVSSSSTSTSPSSSSFFANTTTQDEDAPVIFNLTVYMIMLILGLGLLTPWNVVLNAIPYLQSSYSKEEGDNLAFYLTLAYTYPGLPILLLMVWKGHLLPLTPRIVISLVAQAVIMVVMPLISSYSIWVPLSLMFINGLCTMVLQSSLFGLVGHFAPIYNQAIMGGQGWAGVVACVSQLIVLGASTSSSSGSSGSSGSGSNKTASIAYFLFAALVMLGCAVSYLILIRHPYAKPIIAAAEHSHASSSTDTNDDTASLGTEAIVSADDINSAAEATDNDDDDGKSPLLNSSSASGFSKKNTKRGGNSSSSSGGGASAAAAKDASSSATTTNQVSAYSVFKKISPMAFAVCTVFALTFILFPSVMYQFPYRGDLGAALDFPALTNNSGAWWSAILLTTFNVLDTVGRMLPAKIICISQKWLLPITLCRFAFIPLFMGCVNGWGGGNIFNDASSIFILMMFSVTNGYFASLAFMFAPSRVSGPEKQTAGFIMSLMLNLGIVTGSQIALVFKH